MKYSNVGWMTLVAVAMVTLLTAGVPTVVQAQSTGLRVNLPFEFQVGNKVLPPGNYEVWQSRSGDAIVISDGNGHSGTSITNAVLRPNLRSAGVSSLVFNVYGDRYFLNEIRWAGYPAAKGLLKSQHELELAKAATSGKTITEIAAK